MQIGIFHKNDDGSFEGNVTTLSFGADLVFEPATAKTKDRAPDFRITNTATGFETGAAWNETSERTGKPYISVKIDDPAFAYPLWGAITGGENGEYLLVWNRPRPKNGSDKPDQGTL